MATAARLRQRALKERVRSRRKPCLSIQFPMNEAIKAKLSGQKYWFSRRHKSGLFGCAVCKAFVPRDCLCGANFASHTKLLQLTSFLQFVRKSSTPIYTELDPADQASFSDSLSEVMSSAASTELDDIIGMVVTFVCLAALSGRPSTMKSLSDACDWRSRAEVSQAIRHFCQTEAFFRGGQAHGALRKEDVAGAFESFIDQGYHTTLTAHVRQLVSAEDEPVRLLALRNIFGSLRQCA